MGKKKNTFQFAPDRLTIRVIPTVDCDMDDFESLVESFRKEFKDLDITLSEDVYTHKWFAFNIESNSYIKFKRIRKVFDFLESEVLTNDDMETSVGEVYF